jgi:pachytene checkpoint protein 2
MDALINQCDLPLEDFAQAWQAIKIDAALRERLVAQAVLALQVRQRVPFEVIPVHGLIVLAGPPGTGKTTLARGLANEVARVLQPAKVRFLEVDPHALVSSSLGKSQREVTKLFQQVIPEHASQMPCIVLLDEVETLAADRERLSLEANPIDVHRATDAALAGIDALTRKSRNTLLIATTNFERAVDRALLSRADSIERIGLPNADARREMISDVLDALASVWPATAKLKRDISRFVAASDGLDGRRLRKAVLSALASNVETARDPNLVTAAQMLSTLERVAAATEQVAP